jgi:hypothetical protein
MALVLAIHYGSAWVSEPEHARYRDDANEFDKFDVKKVDPTKDTGITVDNL